MASNISDLDNLPEIDLLKDLDITFDSIQEDMITDYQDKYEEVTGKETLLYPANPMRCLLNVASGQFYQVYEYISYLFKQNFIKYMEENVLKNWGATLGFSGNNLKAATCILEFKTSDILDFDVHVPAGTKVTAGDDVYFSTGESCMIKAGQTSVQVKAVCTQEGSVGNEYMPGQINTMTDPVLNIASVSNTTTSYGGSDDYTLEELREMTYIFPSTYSVAGPEDAYVFFVKNFSDNIISVNVVTDNKTATVMIYIMLSSGNIPDIDYCNSIHEYLKELKKFPDTDKMIVKPPDVVSYELSATYYISMENKDTESTIKQSVSEAAQAFVAEHYENIGRDINPDIFTEYARVAGAKRVKINTPVYTKIEANQIAICSGIALEYGGLEDI